MRRPGVFLLFITFSPLLLGQITTQFPSSWEVFDRFNLAAPDSVIQLSREFVLDSSELVVIDSGWILKRGADYSPVYRFGTIRLHSSVLDSLSQIQRSHFVEVRYRAVPISFRREYTLRELVVRKDSLGEQWKFAVPKRSGSPVDDLFGPDLQKSGSIFRGFTLGSNRDLSLSSGFRMQLAGKLGQEVDIAAALTDENSPIQPEGTTQTLQEVDKVYVELKHPSFGATLGDFNLEISQQTGGEFARITRKLQGAQGVARSERLLGAGFAGEISLTGATARGKYNTNRFQGAEGSQGPYRLSGQQGERRIIVVPGTERVYVNGELMKRGEINDYTVDYSSAELVFTSRRLITSASRIAVDFEYSDRQYERNLVGASGSANLNDRWRFNAVLFQESDDTDSPIDVVLDENSRELLRNSGSDRLKASLPGARFVGKDSVTNSSRGQYALRDTIIGAQSYGVFVYVPGDSDAVYSVSFSSVDAVPQDSAGYVRVGLGHFQFAGIGKGNYLPRQLLPLPQLLRVVDINSAVLITGDLSLSGEIAVSQLDQNRLSALDDAGREGQAFKIGARFNPRAMTLGSWNLGEADLLLFTRSVSRTFSAGDRINDVEFDRNWNLETEQRADETIHEASLAYRPWKGVEVTGGYGSLDRKGVVKSARTNGELRIADSTLFAAAYKVESIRRNDAQSADISAWLRQEGSARYDIGLLIPGIRVWAEERSTVGVRKDSLEAGSFKFIEVGPRIESKEFLRMRGTAEVQVRTEDSVLAGTMRKGFQSITQFYTWSLREWNSLSSSLALSIRNTRFSEAFRARGNSNSSVLLIRSQSRFTPLQRALETDLFYEFSNQRSSRLERVFIRVAQGSGNYRYKGDLNGNSIVDENEFELTRFEGDYVVTLIPSEALYPIADLKASARIRLQPSRMFSESGSFASRVLSAISTETYGRVDEKSSETDTRRIYFLDFRAFQNERTTIAGSTIFSQDIHLFEFQPELSFRFRFQQRKGFLQLVSANERSYVRERSVRIRSQLVREIANLTEYVNKADRVDATVDSPREHDIHADFLNTDFSYRPEREWEIGFKLEVGRATDGFEGGSVIADWNEQGLRVVYGFVNRGQARAEMKREEVGLTGSAGGATRLPPFELTGGRVMGKTFQWSAGLDYRINQNIQVTMNYNGRSEGNRAPVHFARAEARAFF